MNKTIINMKSCKSTVNHSTKLAECPLSQAFHFWGRSLRCQPGCHQNQNQHHQLRAIPAPGKPWHRAILSGGGLLLFVVELFLWQLLYSPRPLFGSMTSGLRSILYFQSISHNGNKVGL